MMMSPSDGNCVVPSGHGLTNRFGVTWLPAPGFCATSEPAISNVTMAAKNEVVFPIRIMSLSTNVAKIYPRLNQELTFGGQEVLVQRRDFLIIK